MHKRREIAVSCRIGRLENLRAVIRDWARRNQSYQAGATLIRTTGYWNGIEEAAVIIRMDWPADDNWIGRRLWQQLVKDIADASPDEALGHATGYEVHFKEVDLQKVRDRHV